MSNYNRWNEMTLNIDTIYSMNQSSSRQKKINRQNTKNGDESFW